MDRQSYYFWPGLFVAVEWQHGNTRTTYQMAEPTQPIPHGKTKDCGECDRDREVRG